jgi:hypothetical protein
MEKFKKIKVFLLIGCLIFSSIACSKNTAISEFTSSIHPIPMNTQKLMHHYTWDATCPVSLQDLSEVKLTYFGFDHKAHQGVLIVNKKLANEVIEIFKEIYEHRFPIQQMELMDVFKGSDHAAMNANNTSAFNCRFVMGKKNFFSQHSYGRAIDINTLINPWVKGKTILPAAGEKFIDRTKPYPGKIIKNDFVYKAFKKHGWSWGGDWKSLQDYQHFQKRGH